VLYPLAAGRIFDGTGSKAARTPGVVGCRSVPCHKDGGMKGAGNVVPPGTSLNAAAPPAEDRTRPKPHVVVVPHFFRADVPPSLGRQNLPLRRDKRANATIASTPRSITMRLSSATASPAPFLPALLRRASARVATIWASSIAMSVAADDDVKAKGACVSADPFFSFRRRFHHRRSSHCPQLTSPPAHTSITSSLLLLLLRTTDRKGPSEVPLRRRTPHSSQPLRPMR
jgi:hypothetical protein